MRLSDNNFYKGTTFLKNGNGAMVYTYESCNAMYDVMVHDGDKYYQKNLRGYSNRIDSIENIHYAIERHFNI